MLHDFVIGVELLTYRLFHVSDLRSADQVKLMGPLSSAVRHDQSCLLAVILVRYALVDRSDASLQLTFLVQRRQKWHLLAHFCEFE